MATGTVGILKIIVMIVLCFAVSSMGAVFTSPSIPNWYASLTRPPLTPPSWVFGLVWPILYAMMGTAAGIVWYNGLTHPKAKLAMALFLGQLLLNAIWTPLFFGQHAMAMALIDLVALWAMIVLTILAFRQQSALASALLVPYLIWVSFAVYLNAGFWYLNR